jgi:hypothetical protein
MQVREDIVDYGNDNINLSKINGNRPYYPCCGHCRAGAILKTSPDLSREAAVDAGRVMIVPQLFMLDTEILFNP